MNKCYMLLYRKNGSMSSACMHCSYWKDSVRHKTIKICYEYFDCKEDCAFKNGKIPEQKRAFVDENSNKGRFKLKQESSIKNQKSLELDNFIRTLKIFLDEEKK